MTPQGPPAATAIVLLCLSAAAQANTPIDRCTPRGKQPWAARFAAER